MKDESVEVKLARIEEGLVALRGEIRIYHKELVHPMKDRVDSHHVSIAILRRDRFWISGMVAIASSWLGLKLFGKG